MPEAPWDGYDQQSIDDIDAALSERLQPSFDEIRDLLARVQGHEAAGRDRRGVTALLARLREHFGLRADFGGRDDGEPWPGYDGQTIKQMAATLAQELEPHRLAILQVLDAALDYEEAGRDRDEVVEFLRDLWLHFLFSAGGKVMP